MDSLPINAQWGLHFLIHMTTFFKGIGMPDLFLELQGPKGDRPLWVADIVSSQEEEVASTVRHYMECQDVVLVSIIDIRESSPYKPPKHSSDAAKAVNEWQDLLTFREWHSGTENPAFGSIASSIPHRSVVDSLTITIKTWLRNPEGKFSTNANQHCDQYYTCTQIGPNFTPADTSHLDLLLGRGMRAIQNSIVDYIVQHCQLTDGELSAIRQWTPSARVFDWEQVMKYVNKAALWDGYGRYRQWHDTTKRSIDETTGPESQGESNKRPKRA
ncbi:hypothetical protein EV424DRAFT_1544592 [Suillus variegatus]|nr:hypothetical protein EV424DRAFT_1544592 [Suillus variegatus]